MIKYKARKEFTVSNLYSKIKIMKKKTIAIIQCILYLIAPYKLFSCVVLTEV